MLTLEHINFGARHYDTAERNARYWAGYHRQLGSLQHAAAWDRKAEEARRVAAGLRALVDPLPDVVA